MQGSQGIYPTVSGYLEVLAGASPHSTLGLSDRTGRPEYWSGPSTVSTVTPHIPYSLCFRIKAIVLQEVHVDGLIYCKTSPKWSTAESELSALKDAK